MTSMPVCIAALIALSCTAQPLNGDWAIDSAFSDDEQAKVAFGLDWWSGLVDEIDWAHHVEDNPSGDWSVRRGDGIPADHVGALTSLGCEVRLWPDTLRSHLMLRDMVIHEAAHCALQTLEHYPGRNVLAAESGDVRRCLTREQAAILCERYGCEADEIERLCEETR